MESFSKMWQKVHAVTAFLIFHEEKNVKKGWQELTVTLTGQKKEEFIKLGTDINYGVFGISFYKYIG